jgi:hypothetical protein
MIFSVGRSVRIERTRGYLFIRAPFLGEILWDRNGVVHSSWRKVKAVRDVHALLARVDAWNAGLKSHWRSKLRG